MNNGSYWHVVDVEICATGEQEVHHQREWQGVGLDVRCKEADMQGQSQE